MKGYVENIKDKHQYTSIHLGRLKNLTLKELLDETRKIAIKVN
jgi:hypothetical protein